MGYTVTATLAPDTGEIKYSDEIVLKPGESAKYTAVYGAGDTQLVSFQKQGGTGFWETVASATMDGSPDNFTGIYKNESPGNEKIRFRNKQTATSTDESASVTIVSFSGLKLTSFDDQRVEEKQISLQNTGCYASYERAYIDTAAISSDNKRLFATVNNVIAGTVRGLHCSLSFGTSGTITGLGVAAEFTLHIPSTAGQTGTLAPIKLAINSDASTSDPAGATSLSYIRIDNQGDATGGADVDDDVNLIDLSGHTVGNGNLVSAVGTAYALAEFTHSIRIKIGDTLYYIPISNLAASAT